MTHLVFDLDRHREGERRSEPRLGFDPNPPAVHLDDAFGDRKSQPTAALLLGDLEISLLKLLENPGLVLLGDARPGVVHIDRVASIRC